MDTKIPFLFAGSSSLSTMIVTDEIIGWGKPDANYFFQVWRDLPSHIIYYRDMIGTQFLPEFNIRPVSIPKQSIFRYDYLVSGEVPDGSWIQFSAGVNEKQPIISNIVIKQYQELINDLVTYKLTEENIVLDPLDFLILLTNLGSSTGTEDIKEHAKDNVLIGNDDFERREFNDQFYKNYIDWVQYNILNDQSFLKKFINLSGVHILAYIINQEQEIEDYILNIWDNMIDYAHPALHALILESKLGEYDKAKELLPQLRKEMLMIQSLRPSFFMNKINRTNN